MAFAFSIVNRFCMVLSYARRALTGPQRWFAARAVAVAPLADGDELLLNYRFNPAHEAPAWYVDPDPAQAKRRWAPLPIGYKLVV